MYTCIHTGERYTFLERETRLRGAPRRGKKEDSPVFQTKQLARKDENKAALTISRNNFKLI